VYTLLQMQRNKFQRDTGYTLLLILMNKFQRDTVYSLLQTLGKKFQPHKEYTWLVQSLLWWGFLSCSTPCTRLTTAGRNKRGPRSCRAVSALFGARSTGLGQPCSSRTKITFHSPVLGIFGPTDGTRRRSCRDPRERACQTLVADSNYSTPGW